MKFGENNLNTRKAGFGLDVHWDTSTVVFNGHAAVFLQFDKDFLTVSSKGLVDAVVDDFPKAVHQTAPVGGADIHSRAFTNRL